LVAFQSWLECNIGENNTEITRADAARIHTVTTRDWEPRWWRLALSIRSIHPHTGLLCVSIRNETFSASRKLYCVPYGTICVSRVLRNPGTACT
jgi:hypothetical protein